MGRWIAAGETEGLLFWRRYPSVKRQGDWHLPICTS